MAITLYSTNARECEEVLTEYSKEFLKVKFLDSIYLSYNVLTGFVKECLDVYNMQNYDRPLDAQYFEIENVVKTLHKQRETAIYNLIMQRVEKNNEMQSL